MNKLIKKIILVISLSIVLCFSIYQVQQKVLAEQTGSSPESGATSRIKTIYDSLVSLSHGSESAGAWGNWGVMWNRIRSAGEWVPSGDASESDVTTGKTFVSNNRALKTGTKAVAETCIPFTVNHLASGGVAPVDKTITYGIVKTSIGGTGEKCWITQNLGAYNQAAVVSDATEAAAGWYFQFNRKQGYKVADDGVTRTPSSAWDATDDNTYTGWDPAKDPCTLELGTGWRLPTYTEYYNMDNTGGWTTWTAANGGPWGSVLKLHGAGYLARATGVLGLRGSEGFYWNSSQDSVTNGWRLDISSSESSMLGRLKSFGYPVRCLKD